MIRPTMSHAVNKDDLHRLMSEYATYLEQQLAKANEAASFYKEQYEKVDRECTKLAMREAKANERVRELEAARDKFAIENQVKGAEALIYAFPLNTSDQMRKWVEQLRKEQE